MSLVLSSLCRFSQQAPWSTNWPTVSTKWNKAVETRPKEAVFSRGFPMSYLRRPRTPYIADFSLSVQISCLQSPINLNAFFGKRQQVSTKQLTSPNKYVALHETDFRCEHSNRLNGRNHCKLTTLGVKWTSVGFDPFRVDWWDEFACQKGAWTSCSRVWKHCAKFTKHALYNSHHHHQRHVGDVVRL